MARIHSVSPYPTPSHSRKGKSKRLTSGAPSSPSNAPAFSGAAMQAERRERERVLSGAPGHLIAQGLPGKPVVFGGSPPLGPSPGRSPLSFPEGLAEKLRSVNPVRGRPPR